MCVRFFGIYRVVVYGVCGRDQQGIQHCELNRLEIHIDPAIRLLIPIASTPVTVAVGLEA